MPQKIKQLSFLDEIKITFYAHFILNFYANIENQTF
jgi:hypothetical protein